MNRTAAIALACLPVGCGHGHGQAEPPKVDIAAFARDYVNAHFAAETFAGDRRVALELYGHALKELPDPHVEQVTPVDRKLYVARTCLVETMGPQATDAADAAALALAVDARRLQAHVRRTSTLPSIRPGEGCDPVVRGRG